MGFRGAGNAAMRKHRPSGAQENRRQPRWPVSAVPDRGWNDGGFHCAIWFHGRHAPRRRGIQYAAASPASLRAPAKQSKRDRHSGAMRSIEPGISRFRVWSFGPSRNDSREYGVVLRSGTHAKPLRGARRPRFCLTFSPFGKQRARGMPGGQCTRSLVCAGGSEYAYQYSQRKHRKTSGIPHAMVFTAYT
jgi:hypothetical protein